MLHTWSTKNILARMLLLRLCACRRIENVVRDDQPYVPPTKPYELSVLVADLVLLGRYLLKPNGRLVFFLPTVTDDYHEIDINTMLCDGMEVIANSLQDFGSWGRRVSVRPVSVSHTFLS